MSLIVSPWKFDVLKASIFALDASLVKQIIICYKFQISRGQLSVDSLSTETIYCITSLA